MARTRRIERLAEDLNARQVAVLVEVGEGATSADEISRRLSSRGVVVEPKRVWEITEGLNRDGLVARPGACHRGRPVVLSPTEKGRELVERVRRIIRGNG